jgi:hypothetical protein
LNRPDQCLCGSCSRCKDAIRQFRPFQGAGQLKRADERCKHTQRNALWIVGRRQSVGYLTHQGLGAFGIEGPRFRRLPRYFRQ